MPSRRALPMGVAGKMVQLQQLAELEEIISHRAAPDAFPTRRLVSLWSNARAASTPPSTPTPRA